MKHRFCSSVVGSEFETWLIVQLQSETRLSLFRGGCLGRRGLEGMGHLSGCRLALTVGQCQPSSSEVEGRKEAPANPPSTEIWPA